MLHDMRNTFTYFLTVMIIGQVAPKNSPHFPPAVFSSFPYAQKASGKESIQKMAHRDVVI